MKTISALSFALAMLISCNGKEKEKGKEEEEAPTLSVTPDTRAVIFSAAGVATTGSAEIIVTTNVAAGWTAVSDQTSWLTVTASGKSGDKLMLTAAPNLTTATPPEATVTINAGNATPVEITATQGEAVYEFGNGVMPRNILEDYLSRSITQAEFLVTDPYYNDGEYPYKEDDTRMLKNIGAKFIGRSIYTWNNFFCFNNANFLKNAKSKIEEMHAFDPDIIFQGAIFEIVSTKVDYISVPAWVFEAFGMPVETRNFIYRDMLNKQGQYVNNWGTGASVPDITQLETRLFFYFMARKYMEIGVEAIHFGQAELMAMSDKNNNYASWKELLDKVRKTALTVARHGTVICDAHLPSGGIVIDGKLLFDFVSFPMRPREVMSTPQNATLQKNYLDAIYGKTKGGVTPSGWSCDRCPYIIEFDNFGISSHPGTGNLNEHSIWGYDEISWFYKQPESYRNEFLEYANNWIKTNDTNGFLQMPGSRVITGCDVNRYRANTQGDACPLGKSQEETIKRIWNR